MVLWDSPVAWTTAVLPPQPIPIASAAAHCLRILSFMRGLRSLNLRRRLSTITESGILTEEHLGSYCQVIIAQFLSSGRSRTSGGVRSTSVDALCAENYRCHGDERPSLLRSHAGEPLRSLYRIPGWDDSADRGDSSMCEQACRLDQGAI